MNLALLPPFERNYPEGITATLERPDTVLPLATCARFSPIHGHLLCAGYNDGAVFIWDMMTRRVRLALEGHVRAITSISWSGNERYVLTSSLDWTCILWDIETTDTFLRRVKTVRFDTVVVSAHLHPRIPSMFIACPYVQRAVLVDVSNRSKTKRTVLPLPTDPDGVYRPEGNANDLVESLNVLEEGADAVVFEEGKSLSKSSHKRQKMDTDAKSKPQDYVTWICYDPKSSRLAVTGTKRGYLAVLDIHEGEGRVLFSTRAGGNAAVRHIHFDPSGSELVVSLGDRTIRTYHYHRPLKSHLTTAITGTNGEHNTTEVNQKGGTIDVKSWKWIVPTGLKFQDTVDRQQWNACGYSPDGEYVIGGSDHRVQHALFIWDRYTTGLVTMLDGPKDTLYDVTWHPLMPTLVTVTAKGHLLLWSREYEERYSAYEPKFIEIHENEVYEEREDEFDVKLDEDLGAKEDGVNEIEEEDELVDVVQVEPVGRVEWACLDHELLL